MKGIGWEEQRSRISQAKENLKVWKRVIKYRLVVVAMGRCLYTLTMC